MLYLQIFVALAIYYETLTNQAMAKITPSLIWLWCMIVDSLHVYNCVE